MKNSILITATVLLSNTIISQDMLVTGDSTRLKARVLEISQDAIRYKLLENEGPTYVISKSNVAYVVYQNGTSERFKPKADESALNKYNLDGSVPLKDFTRKPKEKKNEDLYKGRNYLGFNHLALLNSSISFSYMRDLPNEKMVLHIPFSIGTGKPDLTNGVYNGPYTATGSNTTYNIMRYQVGLGLLFSPTFGEKVNFLIGPSLNFAQYDMSTKTVYPIGSYYYGPVPTEEFQNDFILFRQTYGGTIGFLFRITSKLNMTMMANLGMKKDSYSEKDPYGIEYINSKTEYKRQANANVLPYANFSWTLGYRF
jgi:hypothetical protein